MRLLQNIARIPEIEQLWHDILYNPTILAPSFTGLGKRQSLGKALKGLDHETYIKKFYKNR